MFIIRKLFKFINTIIKYGASEVKTHVSRLWVYDEILLIVCNNIVVTTTYCFLTTKNFVNI